MTGKREKDRDAKLPATEGPSPQEDVVVEPKERNSLMGFPIVGVGASAGGVEAFTHLLEALPAETGMAFVLVPHLDPSHGSVMAEILGRATSMSVMQVEDEPLIEPNHIYVIPPNRN